MLLLMDQSLMRGDDARRIQLCDIFHHPVEQLQPHQRFPFATVTYQGKVNRVCPPVVNDFHRKIARSHALQLQVQNGRTEFAWIMRHKDALQCGVGATLRWLLWLF